MGIDIPPSRDEIAQRTRKVELLERDHRRIQDRIDFMYLDKLDGRIDADFFDRKAAEWKIEQTLITRDLSECRHSGQNFLPEGVRLLQLAQRVADLFENQSVIEKRSLLDFVLSNCRWKSGELAVQYRKPFDMLADTLATQAQRKSTAGLSLERTENWLPTLDAIRTLAA